MRDIITLECTSCKRRNYSTTKNKKKQTGRLSTKSIVPGAINERRIKNQVTILHSDVYSSWETHAS